VTVAARRLATPSSVNAAIKQIADVMRRANYAGALQYVPELSWILFLRILDEREELEAEEARALEVDFAPSLQAPFRWRDWASPGGAKREELSAGAMGAFLPFVNGELLPYLRGLGRARARRSGNG
jgi:type I restriction enzyme M protein